MGLLDLLGSLGGGETRTALEAAADDFKACYEQYPAEKRERARRLLAEIYQQTRHPDFEALMGDLSPIIGPLLALIPSGQVAEYVLLALFEHPSALKSDMQSVLPGLEDQLAAAASTVR